MVRRGFWISSPMAESGLDAAEGEEDAGPEDGVVERPMRDQLARVKWVAAPKRHQETAASRISNAERKRLPSEPTLLSHFPASTPRMLSRVMSGEPKCREGDEVERIGGQALRMSAEGKECGGCAEIEHGREEREVAHPVGPGADEA